MELKITCIPGDGIGPEIVTEAKKALNAVAEKYGHDMQYTDILIGRRVHRRTWGAPDGRGGGDRAECGRGADGFDWRRHDHFPMV